MNELLTVKETAKLLDIEIMTVYRWINSGKLPSYKKGGHRRLFKKEDVERLANEKGQLVLDIKTRKRTASELEYFKQLEAKLTRQELLGFLSNTFSEHDWHQLILDLARRYNVSIPKWFEKECRVWGVNPDEN